MTEIFDKVKHIISDTYGVDEEEITETTSLKDDLNLDSLDAVELIMRLEEEFDIEISDEDSTSITTVKEMVELIEKTQL